MRVRTSDTPHSTVHFDPNWKSILECAVVEVFEMMARIRLAPNPASDGEPQGEQTAMVGMAGALCGITTLQCSRETAAKFASLMLDGDAVSNPSTIRDAIGELCNMIAGNFKAKIGNLADRCMLSVPTVITGESYSMEIAEPCDGFTISLTFEGEPVWVSLVVHSRN
jgi:chemotaxis protein CheX